MAALFALCSNATAQTTTPAQTAPAQRSDGYRNTVFDKLDIGPGGPAPRRELTGAWAGPIAGRAVEEPPVTELGKRLLSSSKPEATFKVSGTNDPYVRTCDPLGFPRNIIFETRGIAFAAMADRVVLLNQYQKVWREIWTDGRALPKNVGRPGGPDTRYYGYSVGHWENDNTFVVDTVGLDDGTWLNNLGYPHTSEARVQERYVRTDHNHLELTVTVEDPKLYTKPFVLGTNSFKWLPNQEFEEQLCIPSKVIEYLQLIGDPAQ
jgi:hypothetical protein